MLARTIAVANQKGGVGKTTTCVNLASAFGGMHFRVLLLDMDPQANATTGCGVDKLSLKRSAYDVLVGEASVRESVIQLDELNFDLLPANGDLTAAEIELLDIEEREYALNRAINSMTNEYWWIFID